MAISEPEIVRRASVALGLSSPATTRWGTFLVPQRGKRWVDGTRRRAGGACNVGTGWCRTSRSHAGTALARRSIVDVACGMATAVKTVGCAVIGKPKGVLRVAPALTLRLCGLGPAVAATFGHLLPGRSKQSDRHGRQDVSRSQSSLDDLVNADGESRPRMCTRCPLFFK